MAVSSTRAPLALPALGRRDRGRMAGGVCSGLAATLHADVNIVRFAFVALGVAGGAGVALYLVLWFSLPERTRWPAARPVAPGSIAVLVATIGAVLLARSSGLWFGDLVALPTLVAGAGAIVAGGRAGSLGPAFPARIAVGLSMLVAGGAVAGGIAGDVQALAGAAVGSLVLGSGLALIAWPWLSQLSGDLAVERRQRIRSEERATLAAHLHDSVLQTLALIQKRADDPRAVRTMARRQERELRDWLYGGGAATGGAGEVTLAGRVRAAADEVEDAYGVRVEVVTVGDTAGSDTALQQLAAASAEAMRNAAGHSGVDVVDVYVEVAGGGATVFVRDRGCGFDPARVGPDRRGIRDSIERRMAQAGGRASVRSAPGDGTEVELWAPVPEAAHG